MSRLLFLASNATPSSSSLRVLRTVESRARRLGCVAVGGYPPPGVQLYVGTRDVTSQFAFSNSVSLASGVQGLRHVSVQSERWNGEFEVAADDDGSVVKCVATVPGLRPTVQRIQLHVDCKYDDDARFNVPILVD